MMRKRLLGGVLLLVGASIGLASALDFLLTALADIRNDTGMGLEGLGVLISLPLVFMSIAGLVGGVLALVGRAWFFVILAGAAAIPGTALPEAFLYPIVPFLALIAVVITGSS